MERGQPGSRRPLRSPWGRVGRSRDGTPETRRLVVHRLHVGHDRHAQGRHLDPRGVLRDVRVHDRPARDHRGRHDPGLPPLQLVLSADPLDRARCPDRGHAGTRAKVLPGAVLRVARREVGVGEEGEMVVSGRQLASAYWQGRGALAPIPQDGFRNGDLARRDADGYVYITGRKKDIIIKGGVNIASLEITNRLLEHADVADAATLGVKDDIYGEVPVGFVVPRPGPALTAPALLEHCRDKLAALKVPHAVVIVDPIPKNPNGQI